eukprot:GFYU01026383.1.p1 GENE.GFYU01026383.1~~GFYU01026383.1.p1  ORF type:complete len:239 (+),score=61.62 GFYU01026383.1:85-717(+)
MFEVLEGCWEELVEDMNNATDLDELISAHSKYLDTLVDRALMGGNSSLLDQLNKILDIIIRFHNSQKSLFTTLYEEHERRKKFEQSVVERTEAGGWGVTDDDETPPIVMPREAWTQLRDVVKEYEDSFKTFTFSLNGAQSTNLRFLTFRLDFNEYYQKREDREARAVRQGRLYANDDLKPDLHGSAGGALLDPNFESMVDQEIRSQMDSK